MNNLLFIDTESNPNTKEPECVTWLFNGEKGIIEDFNWDNYIKLYRMWNNASAVVMFNAPYDLGVLSILWNNSYKWVITEQDGIKSSYWNMKLFGQGYQVRKIGFTRNLIRPTRRKDPVPVIDVLKLWEILIEDKDISLKSLITRVLGHKAIKWSEKNAKTDAYRYQDVVYLSELWDVFLEKIKNIEGIDEYSYEEWGNVKTPATFCKQFYSNHYDDLKEWKKENDEKVKAFELKGAFEAAFHGGLTMAFYRGDMTNTGWMDIKGAYSKAIEVINTDKYLKFDIDEVKNFDFNDPYLLLIESNFILKNMNNGLQLFYVDTPCQTWIWNYDIVAIKNLIDDFTYNIIECFKIIPLLEVNKSLPVQWNDFKNDEFDKHGKTTLYYFYKFLSNTSYGIKAQRRPFETIHTNLAIAGMITSKVHSVLTGINKVLRDEGYPVHYNDTDSACFSFNDVMDGFFTLDNLYDTHITKMGIDFNELVIKINDAIYPFQVECEGVFERSKILSLKRYISIGLDKYRNTNDEIVKGGMKEKIRLHGKGRYQVTQKEIKDYAMTRNIEGNGESLKINQFGANTAIGMKMCLNLQPFLENFKHPFMFLKDVESDRTKRDFMHDWFFHIDGKLTFEQSGEFNRTYLKFEDIYTAIRYFKNLKGELQDTYQGMNEKDMSNWDIQTMTDFNDMIDPDICFDNRTNVKIPKDLIKHPKNPKKHKKPEISKKLKKTPKTHICKVCQTKLVIGKNISHSHYKNYKNVCNECRAMNENRIKNMIGDE